MAKFASTMVIGLVLKSGLFFTDFVQTRGNFRILAYIRAELGQGYPLQVSRHYQRIRIRRFSIEHLFVRSSVGLLGLIELGVLVVSGTQTVQVQLGR